MKIPRAMVNNETIKGYWFAWINPMMMKMIKCPVRNKMHFSRRTQIMIVMGRNEWVTRVLWLTHKVCTSVAWKTLQKFFFFFFTSRLAKSECKRKRISTALSSCSRCSGPSDFLILKLKSGTWSSARSFLGVHQLIQI